MEAKKSGAFIAARRKELQMTQRQLSEELGISDKTVSKWETGNGLPDMAIILPLCQLLEINVNELLSGERQTQDAYHRKAEENMMNLMQDYENEKKGAARQIAVAAAWSVALIVIMFLPVGVSGMLEDEMLRNYYDLPSLMEVILVPAVCLGLAGHLKDFANGFRYLFWEADNEQKLENAVKAVSMAIKSMLASGAFFSVLSMVYLMFTLNAVASVQILGINLAVASLTLLYSILGALLLIPVKGRLERKVK